MSHASPRVESFVLRFVRDASFSEASNWHAVVLHVQTNEERICSDFADAVAFIARYVPIGGFIFKTEDEGQQTDDCSRPSAVLGLSGE